MVIEAVGVKRERLKTEKTERWGNKRGENKRDQTKTNKSEDQRGSRRTMEMMYCVALGKSRKPEFQQSENNP